MVQSYRIYAKQIFDPYYQQHDNDLQEPLYPRPREKIHAMYF